MIYFSMNMGGAGNFTAEFSAMLRSVKIKPTGWDYLNFGYGPSFILWTGFGHYRRKNDINWSRLTWDNNSGKYVKCMQ